MPPLLAFSGKLTLPYYRVNDFFWSRGHWRTGVRTSGRKAANPLTILLYEGFAEKPSRDDEAQGKALHRRHPNAAGSRD
jgi:hypothetical protein